MRAGALLLPLLLLLGGASAAPQASRNASSSQPAVGVSAQHKTPCAKGDHPDDCKALVDLASTAHLAGWKSKKNWLKDESVCTWNGVTCKDKRVETLALKANGLSGSLPESLGGLSELKSLDLAGKRPPGYGPHSCVTGATNFNHSAMPRSFYSLSKLSTWSMEYTCIGGTLAPELGSMLALEVRHTKRTGRFFRAVSFPCIKSGRFLKTGSGQTMRREEKQKESDPIPHAPGHSHPRQLYLRNSPRRD